jgi:plastocyanin
MAAHIIRGRVTRALTLGIAATIALAGCGGSGGGKSVTVPSGKPIAVTASEYRFDPKAIVVTGGGPVRFSLTNGGAQAHDLHVQKGGQDLGGTSIFGPGQTQSATVKLAPGTYDFVCTVGDHEQLGMKGTLTVK